MSSLPEFVPPMLAQLGDEAFDSEDHLFEVKWDGIRALATVEGCEIRLASRHRNDLTPRYPELRALERLPNGTILDGEIVLLRNGVPDFHAVLERERARRPSTVRTLSARAPVTYVAFDVLYDRRRRVLEEPLTVRRRILHELLAVAAPPCAELSEGIRGQGRALFDAVRSRGLEGIVAKELASPYLPGRRTPLWTKVKAFRETVAVILGFIAEGDEVRSLVVGLEDRGHLRCAGRVGSGLSRDSASRLLGQLEALRVPEPWVPCPGVRAVWVRPELYCRLRFLERTPRGLRAPVFLGLVEAPDP